VILATTLPIGDTLIAFALLAFFVLLAVYAWTDLSEEIQEQLAADAGTLGDAAA
jgi:hypothetical protein